MSKLLEAREGAAGLEEEEEAGVDLEEAAVSAVIVAIEVVAATEVAVEAEAAAGAEDMMIMPGRTGTGAEITTGTEMASEGVDGKRSEDEAAAEEGALTATRDSDQDPRLEVRGVKRNIVLALFYFNVYSIYTKTRSK